MGWPEETFLAHAVKPTRKALNKAAAFIGLDV